MKHAQFPSVSALGFLCRLGSPRPDRDDIARSPAPASSSSAAQPRVCLRYGAVAAIASTMPAAPAVPPAPAAVPSHLDQLTLLRHRLGSCGQRSDRGSDSRYAERHRTNHKKRGRNFQSHRRRRCPGCAGGKESDLGHTNCAKCDSSATVGLRAASAGISLVPWSAPSER